MSPSVLNSSLSIPHHKNLSKALISCNFYSKRTISFGPQIHIRNNSGGRCRANSIIAGEKMDDGFYMRRCVELARKAIGRTSPNPMVGCVIVDGRGEIVGEGFHPKAGQPHAEVFALRDAGSLAENAIAYVSLEPCNHYGRTPPCTEALVQAKVKRVVVGMVDPNPIVASKGIDRLRVSGIDVTVGVEEMMCQKLNEAYIHRMLTGKPFVTLRYSMGGRVAKLGEGAEEASRYCSRLLQEYDGIISSNNVFSQTSALPASRETGDNQPLQIIVARGTSSVSLPASLASSSARIIVLAENPIMVEPESESIEVVVLEQMNLSSILDYCGQEGLCSIVLDLSDDNGGLVDLLEDGLDENLVQKVVVELSPVLDRNEQLSVLTLGRKTLRLKDINTVVSSGSVVVEGYI